MRETRRNANGRSGAGLLWIMTAIAILMSSSARLSAAQPDSAGRGGRDSTGMTRSAAGGAAAPAQGGEGGGPGAFGQGGPRGPQAPYVMPPVGKELVSNLHNKLIHFPIVLNLVAAALVLASRRKPEYEPVAFWLVWFALLGTLAAYFSGMAQSTEFQHRPKEWLVNTHMRWGIGLALSQCVWILALIRRGGRGFATVWSFVIVALVLVTGYLGGLVAHGRGAMPPTHADQSAPRANP